MHLFMLQSLLSFTYASVSAFIGTYGYIAIFALTAAEAALPIPSEVILPLVGMVADYYVAYFLEKDVVYKHLRLFHMKRSSVEAFDAWFAKNGKLTVFVSRLIPLVRALINFPAGFAKMRVREFLLYSLAGTIIWSALLMGFGYYAHGLLVANVYYLVIALVLFFVVLYALYRYMMGKIRKQIKS